MDETNSPTKQLYDVEVYNDKNLLAVITVTAESREDASNVAVKNINVKIKKAYRYAVNKN